MYIGAAPKTITNQINDELKAIVTAGFIVKKLTRDADKLIQADAFNGYLLKALVVHLTGELKETIYNIEAAEKIAAYSPEIAEVKTQALSDLGHYDEAIKIYTLHSSARDGHTLEYIYNAGIHIGAYRATLNRMMEATDVMKLNNNEIHTNRIAVLKTVAATLDSTGTSDADVAAMLDCAGSILRRHSLFQKNPDYPFKLSNGKSMVHMRINVPAPLQQVSEMNLQLAQLVAEKMNNIPNGFHVTFKWVNQ